MTDRHFIPRAAPTSVPSASAVTSDSLVMPPSPASLQGPGRLSVHLTLHGDAFALRYQAKAYGYAWTGKEWQREISTVILSQGDTEMDLGRQRLLDLAKTEAAMFTCASSLDTPVLSA